MSWILTNERLSSAKCEMLEGALALEFGHHNFCRIHKTLKRTPAMAAGLADHPWRVEELLEAACLRRKP